MKIWNCTEHAKNNRLVWFTSEQSLADKFLPARLVLDTTPLDPPPSPYPGRRFQPWAAEYELQGWRAKERTPAQCGRRPPWSLRHPFLWLVSGDITNFLLTSEL
jgi:hypothetical protein